MSFHERRPRSIARRLPPHRAPTIYADEDYSTNAREIFERGPFQVVDSPKKAELVWMREEAEFQPIFGKLRPFQLLNHLPNEMALGDKGRLAEHLYAHDRTLSGERGLRVKDLVQETYRLYDPDECARFFAQLPARPSKDNLWILKQTDSSEGVGIRILWHFDELAKYCARAAKGKRGRPYARYVIQRYIKNPLLLAGRKSEIRLYWLVASLEPLLVLMFREGTVRLNTRPFKLADFDNTLIHVTNIAQQKAHPKRDPNAILKWSFADWERYIVEERKLAPKGFLARRLRPQLRRMLSFVARAAAPTLAAGRPKKGLCFTLYGADVILDETLHPWLTEVQEGPALSYDDPIKIKVIPPMLTEAASIMLEIARRRREGLSLKTIEAVKGFDWVINDA